VTVVLETAIVGLGTVSTWHRRALERTPGARLTAVADVDESLVDRTAREWGVAGYAGIDALLESESPDWVHVCTPVATHADLAERALRAGAHVLVEKPVTDTRAAFESLVATADDCDRRCTVVHNQVYYPPLLRARRLVKSGRFGRLHGVSVRWLENNDPRRPDRGDWVLELPGGEFGEGIAHPIYVGLRSAGYPASEADVSVTTVNTTGDRSVGYDGIGVAYRTDDEVVCTIQHHSNTRGSRQVEFFAEEGRVVADVPTQSVFVYPEGYGAAATVDNPMINAAGWAVRNAARAVRSVAALKLKRAVASLRGEEYTVHDTHTPVVRREAAAITGTGEGPTPPDEADWTNRIFTRINGVD
jgi:predicted dehydrogenase